ncbi:MAG: hypothetical protein GY928_22575 [Colwellia sp.]|nr:hypothetical protein [Colwellia sp.]
MIKFGQKIVTTPSSPNYFVSSDLHFFHKGVLSFNPEKRPWSNVDEMTEGLIEHWNSRVCEDDIVLSLGDFSFKGKEATQGILDRLNGNIVHVLGNHCKALRNQIKGIVKYEYLEFRYNGTKVVCSHFPFASWNQQGRGSVHLFGHCHGSFKGIGKSIDVGWDAHGRLLTLEEALAMCNEKELEVLDHHKIV